MPDITDPLPMPEPKLPEKSRPPLPYPDRVPESPMRQSKGPGLFDRLWASKGPGLFDRLWANKVTILRHIIIGGSIIGIYFLAKKYGASDEVAGGAAAGYAPLRKLIEDVFKQRYGKDVLSALLSKVAGAKKPNPGGIVMGDYNKAEVTAFGVAVGNLINAVRDDGVGADDLDELIAAVTAGAKTVNEMKGVPAAAALHVVGAAADVVGDKILADASVSDEKPVA